MLSLASFSSFFTITAGFCLANGENCFFLTLLLDTGGLEASWLKGGCGGLSFFGGHEQSR